METKRRKIIVWFIFLFIGCCLLSSKSYIFHIFSHKQRISSNLSRNKPLFFQYSQENQIFLRKLYIAWKNLPKFEQEKREKAYAVFSTLSIQQKRKLKYLAIFLENHIHYFNRTPLYEQQKEWYPLLEQIPNMNPIELRKSINNEMTILFFLTHHASIEMKQQWIKLSWEKKQEIIDQMQKEIIELEQKQIFLE